MVYVPLLFSHISLIYISQITECSKCGTYGWLASAIVLQSSITAIRDGKVQNITLPSVPLSQIDVMMCTLLPLDISRTELRGRA